MSNSDKFSIEITAEEGQSDGLLSIERTDRMHCDVLAYAVSRERYAKVIGKQDDASKGLREHLDCHGVYILWKPHEKDDGRELYVGRCDGDFEQSRLIVHRNKKKWWQQAVIFTSSSDKRPLNGSQTKYMESELCKLASKTGRCSVDNVNTPGTPILSEKDEKSADQFLEVALSFLPMIGIDAFVDLDKPQETATSRTKSSYTIDDHPFLAKGRRMRPVFEEFSKQVVGIDSSVAEVFTKFFVSYKLKKSSRMKNFVSIAVQDKKILVYLENTREELDDPSGLTDPSRGARTWSQAGKYMVPFDSKKELPAVMHLIKQSFDKAVDGM